MNNWQGIKNGMNLSQKFLDKIKPEYALKNKINGAEKQMESQYAIELQEIRKIKKKISEAKLAMEQIKLRLGTVSELGDIVVTLSPCMSLIKGLAPSISGLMPEMHSSMQDLTNMFGDLLTDSSLSSETMVPTYQGNTETNAILQEAHDVLEGRVKTAIPEPPSTSIQHASPKKESMI